MAKPRFQDAFSGWLERVSRRETPPASVIAYNVGLFESPNGYTAYLCGADHYSDDSSDWACRESFAPKDRYFNLPAQEFKSKGWEEAQEAVITAVKEFLASAQGAQSFLANAQAVTVGFDDGELVRVK
jgi:hypothetical protein